jgi:ATP-dependent RNA helicase DeaD
VADGEPVELEIPASETPVAETTASEAMSAIAAPIKATVAEVGEAASAPRTPRPPMPSPGRSPERLHARESASIAQTLPLPHLATDELAAKPKAEGFRALGLNDQILSDLAAMGWKDPSPIQAAAIPVALSGKDMIGQAQTGTGKTAGFVLPTLQKLYALDGVGPMALMLCPTRELAKQVYNEFIKMAGSSAARAALIYGGVDMNDQYRALERKPHVVIGTPGRVIDHMKRKSLDLSNLATIVLDEADQMLDIGFWPDVTYIMSHTPPQRQVLLFSATFPEQVKELAEQHMKDPERIQIQPEHVTVDRVDQKFIAVPRERKNELLAHFIETFNPPQLVVFCKTKHQTDRVAEVLKRKKISGGAIHGDLPQSKREKTLQGFRSGELQCLVATNVAARGLDIPSVSHVVNYDVPETPEEYVHRIGRTARNGASGVARTFITSEDGQFLLEIEKHIGLLLEEEKVEGFTVEVPTQAATRAIAEAVVGTPRLLKPLIGGIRLGRRR